MATLFANNIAAELIQAALQSKAINLQGSGSTIKSSTERAEADAAYLSKLLELLTTEQPK